MNSYEYYNKNANKFKISVKDAKMNNQINKLTKYLRPNSKILDAGCGTGRDSKTFIDLGYDVVSFDASIEMCKLASKETQHEVLNLKFEDLDYTNEFDAIWASASLLHVSRDNMVDVFDRLYNALKDNGYLYCSYKLRDEDFSKDGRTFTCYTIDSFKEFVSHTKFELLELSTGGDSRPGRNDEMWLIGILKRP